MCLPAALADMSKFTFLEGVDMAVKSGFCTAYACKTPGKIEDAYYYKLSKLPRTTLVVNRGRKDVGSMSLEEMENDDWLTENLSGFALLLDNVSPNTVSRSAIDSFFNSFMGRNSTSAERILSKCNDIDLLDKSKKSPTIIQVRDYKVRCAYFKSKKLVGVYIN